MPITTNLQEMFDKSVRGIIAQGGPSYELRYDPENGQTYAKCLYRSSGGKACAVGLLFTDEERKEKDIAEYLSARHIAQLFGINEKPVFELLEKLQIIHDDSAREAHRKSQPFFPIWFRRLSGFDFEALGLSDAVLAEIPTNG